MSDERGVTEVNGIKEYRYFAGGEWCTAENRKLFDVYRPYDRKSMHALLRVAERRRHARLTRPRKRFRPGRNQL